MLPQTHKLYKKGYPFILMKKSVAGILLLLLSFALVRAENLSDMLDSLDESMVVYFSVFILCFVLLFFALNKFFKEKNRAFSGIIAMVLSFLIVWGVNKSGFDVEGIFLDLGVPQETLTTIIELIVLGGIIFLIIVLKKNSLFVIGGLLIVGSFFVYAQALLFMVGLALVVIGFIVSFRKGKTPPSVLSHS
jgi:hypothetical protein